MGGTGTPGSPGESAAAGAASTALGGNAGGTAASTDTPQRMPQTALLDLTSLPPGLYLLQIETPDGFFAERVVVE